MEQLGYKNYWKVLNAKNYGIPQNRERVFVVSIREDIDNDYTFPEPFELKLRLKDLLEDKVDEKYYLLDLDLALNSLYEEVMQLKQTIDEIDRVGDFNTKTVETYNRATEKIEYLEEIHSKLIQVGNLKGGKWDKINESCRRVYDELGIAPTLNSCNGGNHEPKILTRNID